MIVSDCMSENVIVIEPDSSVRKAAERMRDEDIGFLPVCDSERIHGAVTDRDIATRVVAEGRDPDDVLVREIMTSRIVYIFNDQEVLEAARLMEVKQIRRLVVLNRNKRLVGVVTLGDISTRETDHSLAAEVLEKVSEPGRPEIH